MTPNNITIALSSDNNQIHAMATVMTSVILNATPETDLDFFCLLSNNVSDDNRERLKLCEKLNEEHCKVHIVNMSDHFKDFSLHYKSNAGLMHSVTTPALYRLKLPSLLSKHNKVLYLDTDVLVRKDLSELWEMDISDIYLAGVPVAWAQGKPRDRNRWLKTSRISTMDFYVNSGVLLMNLEKMRQNNIEEKCLSEIGNKNFAKLDPADQLILNFTCVPQIGFIPCTYNVTASNKKFKQMNIFYSPREYKEAFDDPAIFHWTGASKPWKFYNVFLAHEWFRYYLESPFKSVFLQRDSVPNFVSKFKKIIKKII